MNITPFKALLSLGVLAFVALAVRGCWPGNNSYMASLGMTVPNSAVLSWQNYPGLTSDEDLLLIQLPPNKIPALLSQFKKKPNFTVELLNAGGNTLAPTKQFFAQVPRNALAGTFQSKQTGLSWPTHCTFAVDRSAGKVWFYGIDVYN